jgi:hypothetical protein
LVAEEAEDSLLAVGLHKVVAAVALEPLFGEWSLHVTLVTLDTAVTLVLVEERLLIQVL